MRFAEYETLFEIDKRLGKIPCDQDPIQYFLDQIRSHPARNCPEADESNEAEISAYMEQTIDARWRLIHTDNFWYATKLRPYYKIWPAIIPCLESVSLDVRLCDVPHAGPELILLRTKDTAAIVSCTEGDNSISWNTPGNELAGHLFWEPGETIEERLRNMNPRRVCGPLEDNARILRWYVGVQLLCSDDEFIRPDVLNCDKRKFAETSDQKYVEKAKRRGKFGWNVGEHLESVPHLRRPHFGIRYGYWGGEEITPRLRPVKGAVVHRDKMRRIPTGYITPEGVEIEPA